MEVCIKYGNLYKEQRVVGFWNDLGFSLYTVPSACHSVITLEK